MPLQGQQIVVHGHVQQVGFRYATAQVATNLNVTGYVLNRDNGDVEVRAYGDKSAVDELIMWLREGPQQAQVNALEITPIEYMKCDEFICT